MLRIFKLVSEFSHVGLRNELVHSEGNKLLIISTEELESSITELQRLQVYTRLQER